MENKKQGEGGIAILIRNDIVNKTITPQFIEDEGIEFLWVQVETKSRPTFIGTLYGAQEDKPSDELDAQFSIK